MNVVFPSELNELASRTNCKILQVGTDCVFSGRSGEYDELSIHDPIDFYGETKSDGESHLSKTMNIRVSVVGRELDSNVELMNWLLSQPLNAEVEGFTNHLWNGVTPIQLAKLINSILANNLLVPGTIHLVPSSSISKYELLQLIARLGERSDLRINPVSARTSVDRTLRTAFPERNKQLWVAGGYQEIPNIQDMIVEYMDWSY
jgi:dTDP-4-dehydrorhamnose reductase